MADIQNLRGLVLLADWANTVEGKLYIQGAAWSMVAQNQPLSIAVAAIVTVPFDQTNKRFKACILLATEDGTPYPPEAPFRVEAEFECGRPPGMKHGEDSQVPIAALLAGIAFAAGGYRFDLSVRRVNLDLSEDPEVHLADVSFVAK